jgi:hypothetical protein
LLSDGKNDNKFTASANDEINFLVTQSLISKVDGLQCDIEKDTIMDAQTKVRYLRGIENVLKFLPPTYNQIKAPDPVAGILLGMKMYAV